MIAKETMKRIKSLEITAMEWGFNAREMGLNLEQARTRF